MKKARNHIALAWLVLAIQAVWLPQSAMASPGGHGGGSSRGGETRTSITQAADSEPAGGEGFGASGLAVNAWEAAGGRKGTGKSFEQWFKTQRIDWESRQVQLEWEAKTAGWSASGWNGLFGAADATNTAGKVVQFGLNFVPGVGKIANIGLDTARGAAEGYAGALDSGMSQSDAAKTGGVTGTASGLMSAFFAKFGFAKDAGKAVEASRKARTAAKILKTNKALGVALTGTAVQEGIKTVVGDAHTNSVVFNSSPMAQHLQK